MANDEHTRIKTIKEDMRANAKLISDLLDAESDKMRAEEMGDFKDALAAKHAAYLKKEISQMKLNSSSQDSGLKLRVVRELIQKRNQLADELFAAVREDIERFSHSDQYPSYLTQRLAQAPVSAEGIFLVRPEDTDIMRSILKKNGFKNKVENADMALGGFRYTDEKNRIEFSCDLNEAVDEECVYFRHHSNFRLMEGGDEYE